MRIVILCAAFICAAGFGHAIAGWPAAPGTVLCDSVDECEARILAGEKRLRELKILDAVIFGKRHLGGHFSIIVAHIEHVRISRGVLSNRCKTRCQFVSFRRPPQGGFFTQQRRGLSWSRRRCKKRSSTRTASANGGRRLHRRRCSPSSAC